MDFLFKDVAKLNKSSLTQGDIIEKTPEVVERIAQAHQYYANADHYTHFVILTQSCDLVRRQGKFKAPYITIAAAKPFRFTVGDFLERQLKSIDGAEFSYHSISVLGQAKQMLERHLNNTEPDFFFLPQSGNSNLPEDLVVFLRLTVALRQEHYETLANAKIAELDDVFQAKLGWLKGNIYSRVATPDIGERDANAASIKANFYKQYIPTDQLVWLSGLQASLLKKKIKAKKQELGRDVANNEVVSIIDDEIPADIEIIAQNLVSKLQKYNVIDEGDLEATKEAVRIISNEVTLKSLVNNRK